MSTEGYEAKMARAQAILKEHFKSIDLDEVGVEGRTSEFKHTIKKLGGTNEDALQKVTWEDLEHECGLPRLIAKQVAEVFRANSVAGSRGTGHVSERVVVRMTTEELLGRYDMEDSDTPVGKRLHELSKGQRFIVLTDVGTVDVETSSKLLAELRKGYTERISATVGGRPRRIYKVGERVDNMVDENPLYPGRPLRPDATCDQTNRSWSGVASEIRQLLRLVVDGDTPDIDRANALIDLAIGEDAMNRLRSRYHEASLEFDELEKRGDLPKLKVELGSNRKEDPFRNHSY